MHPLRHGCVNMPLENLTNASSEQDRDDELAEWLESLDSVAEFEGLERVDEILDAVVSSARRKGAQLPFHANTGYINTIPLDAQLLHH